MTFDEFDQLCNKRLAAVLQMRDTKGKEYAGNTGADRLANFKKSAERAGLAPMQSWLVLADKHMLAIENFVKSGGKTYSTETIQSRITDAILYLLLLEGLIAESE